MHLTLFFNIKLTVLGFLRILWEAITLSAKWRQLAPHSLAKKSKFPRECWKVLFNAYANKYVYLCACACICYSYDALEYPLIKTEHCMTFALNTMTGRFGGMEGGITSCFLGQMFGRPREEGKRKMGHGTWEKPSTETRKCIHVDAATSRLTGNLDDTERRCCTV